MRFKFKQYYSKEKIEAWVTNSKLPLLLTTVKIRLRLILILFIFMLILLIYAFSNQYPQYRQTSICYNKSETLIFKNIYIDCDLRDKNITLSYELMNNFIDFEEINDSLIFNESHSINNKIRPKISVECNYFHRQLEDRTDSISIYGYLDFDIQNTVNVKLDDSYNNFFKKQESRCEEYKLYMINDENNKKRIYHRIERLYYKNEGLCHFFDFHRIRFFSEDLYSPGDNPYTLYELSMPFYKIDDFYFLSEDFRVTIFTNKGKTLVLDVFPEPSSHTSGSIVYEGRKKMEEIMKNGGVYIYLQDIEKSSKISRFQNYASLLAGGILTWIVELLVSIILIWKKLIIKEANCDNERN